jgi:hypothetical protein
MVTSFRVRQQFADGNQVCSIIDWEMALPVAPMFLPGGSRDRRASR